MNAPRMLMPLASIPKSGGRKPSGGSLVNAQGPLFSVTPCHSLIVFFFFDSAAAIRTDSKEG